MEVHGNVEDGCPGECEQLLWLPAWCRLVLPVGLCSPETIQLLVTLVTRALPRPWAEVMLLCGGRVLTEQRAGYSPSAS